MKDLKAFTARRLKLALVAMPLLIAVAYYAVFAVDRYVSESTVGLKQAGSDSAIVPGAALLLAGLNPPAREETLYLRQYIHSLGLLNALEAELHLRDHFESQKLDLPLRLWSGASQETFLDYYRSRVEVSMDELSSTLTVRVQGLSPAYAQRVNTTILAHSERFVNELSHKLAREQLAFAETELARAGERLQQSRADVLAFQTKHKLLDPTVQAQASGALVAEMQASITRSEAELRRLLTFLNDDTYQVKALRNQIESTRAQLELERRRATGNTRQSDRLGALAIEFQGLQMKAEIALDAYKIALTTVENSRIEATRKLKSLVVIEPPTLPETPEYPRALYNLLTLLVITLLVYGVVRLVLATVREHQD